jgi:uracil-DNA glycosylase family 4
VSYVPGEGPTPCDIAFIGEAPGHKEVEAGRPFVEYAPAGKEFARYLRIPRLNRKDIYITNLFKEMLPDNPTADEIEMWGTVLDAEMEEVEPEVIVTMGRYATRHFLGDVNIGDVSALVHSPHSVLPCILPIIHPAAGLYSPGIQASIVAGFRMLKELLEGNGRFAEWDEIVRPSYVESPGILIEDATSLPTALDTEDASKSWVSACAIPGQAIVDKNERSELVGDPLVILHGALYDYPVLDKLGIAPERFVCTQIALFLLGTEPIGLKQAAYRFCGMEMSSYAEITREANEKFAVEYLIELWFQEWPSPDEILTWNRDGTPNIRQPRSLGWLIEKALKDESTDLRKRWNGWDDEVKAPAILKFGTMPVATLDDIDPDVATEYSSRDADATRRLFDPVMERVRETGQIKVLELDMKVIPMLCRMMEVGMKVDLSHFEDLSIDLNREMVSLTERISDIAGYPVNPSSDDQMAKLLYDELGLRVGKLTKKKKRGSVANKVLEGIKPEHPVVALILDYAECDTLESAFSRKLPKFVDEDNRIHPNIRLTATPTGRCSIAEPPLQAIPVRTERGRRIREGFIAPEGRELASWDLDQIEMRVQADLSEDENLCAVLRDPKRHIHKETCSNIYGIPVGQVDKESTEYLMSKNISFGIIYKITAKGLMVQLHQRGLLHYTEEDCQKLIDEWYKLYPGVYRYQEGMIAAARRDWLVRTKYGRIRYLPGIHSTVPYVREEAERQAVNTPIQGTAAEIMKEAMVRFWSALPDLRDTGHCEPILQIHDELMNEQDKGMFKVVDPIMSECMEGAMKLRVPIRCGGNVGANWSELK